VEPYSSRSKRRATVVVGTTGRGGAPSTTLAIARGSVQSVGSPPLAKREANTPVFCAQKILAFPAASDSSRGPAVKHIRGPGSAATDRVARQASSRAREAERVSQG